MFIVCQPFKSMHRSVQLTTRLKAALQIDTTIASTDLFVNQPLHEPILHISFVITLANETRIAATILESGDSSFPMSCHPNRHSISYYVFGTVSIA
jgi:hypothetical protein